MKRPEGLEYYTADEVAETITGITKLPGLYERLWEILSAVKPRNRKAIGGEPGRDEDGQLRVEAPEEAIGSSTEDCAPAWWSKLTEKQQRHVAECFRKEMGE
jgi:hypothetical protein